VGACCCGKRERSSDATSADRPRTFVSTICHGYSGARRWIRRSRFQSSVLSALPPSILASLSLSVPLICADRGKDQPFLSSQRAELQRRPQGTGFLKERLGEQAREWKSTLRKEQRKIERETTKIKREEQVTRPHNKNAQHRLYS
jgi:hypothetical protein